MILYSITHGPRGFMLAKFDEDFNVAAVYNVNTKTCDCPAGCRPTCKHRKMLPRMLGKVDSGEFYCYETQTWHKPLGDLLRPEAGDLEGREELPDAITGEAVDSRGEPLESLMDMARELAHAEPTAVPPLGGSTQQAQAGEVVQPTPPQPTMLIRRR